MYLFMYLTLCLSSVLLWYQLTEQAVREIILQVNLALCPSRVNVDWGLMTNLGAAHFLSMSTSCILYFSIWSLRKELNSDIRPMGRTKSFQLAYFWRIFSLIAKNLFLAISRVLWEWSPVSHGCNKHSWAVSLDSFFLIRSLRIKSLPSSLTFLKASSSKDQSQALTFFRVSISLAPANGESPERST